MRNTSNTARRVVAAAALALLLLVLTGSAALAAWSSPVDLSAAGQTADEPRVAVGPDGTATVVWRRSDGSDFIIQGRQIASSGPPEATPHDLSATGHSADEPQVAVGPDGTATVVWDRSNGSDEIVQERQIAPDGTPDATIHDLSATGEGAFVPQVAVGPDGTATVVWRRFDSAHEIIQERQIAPGGTPDATTHDLSATGEDADRPQVAVAADGKATAVWERSDGSNTIVQERQIAAGGTPDATTNDLSATGEDASNPQVDAGPDGTAAVAWEQLESSYIIQERQIAAGGTPETMAHDLTATGEDASSPGIGVGPDGTANAVWRRSDGSNSIIQARQIAPGGAPAATTDNVSALGQAATQVASAVGVSGVAVATWENTTPGPENGIVQASVFAVPLVSPAPGSGSGAPSNSFKIGKPKLNRRNGTAKLPVTVPGPGALALGGKGVVAQRPAAATVSRAVATAGTVKLLVKAKGKIKRKLNRSGKAKVKVKVTYTPSGGTPNSQSRPLKLRKTLHG